MSFPINITFKDFDHSDAVDARIREKAAHIEKYFHGIKSLRVVVAAPHKHHQKGRTFEVRIDLVVNGAEICINKDHGHDHSHEDIYVAIRDAFDALERRLQDHAQKVRGDVKSHPPTA